MDTSDAKSEGNGEREFDLEERTAVFGEDVIKLMRTIKLDVVNSPLISQIVRSGTSVGANYCEADDAVSRKEFFNKIGTCKKEARETKHWLRMLATSEEKRRHDFRPLWKEAKELHLIFTSILKHRGKEKGEI
jgi:four helix bundle protein